MRKESPLITIWDGDKLVGLQIHCPTASSPQPNRLEEELVRIFNENEQLKKIGEKYSKATEFYDSLIECRFVPLPAVAKKLVNQAGKEILEILR